MLTFVEMDTVHYVTLERHANWEGAWNWCIDILGKEIENQWKVYYLNDVAIYAFADEDIKLMFMLRWM